MGCRTCVCLPVGPLWPSRCVPAGAAPGVCLGLPDLVRASRTPGLARGTRVLVMARVLEFHFISIASEDLEQSPGCRSGPSEKAGCWRPVLGAARFPSLEVVFHTQDMVPFLSPGHPAFSAFPGAGGVVVRSYLFLLQVVHVSSVAVRKDLPNTDSETELNITIRFFFLRSCRLLSHC